MFSSHAAVVVIKQQEVAMTIWEQSIELRIATAQQRLIVERCQRLRPEANASRQA